MMQKKVLIVDDSKLMRIIIKKILSNDDLFVVTGEAGNGIEALSEIERDVPDIIFLDIEMPEMDGVEATREIRQFLSKSDLPIIALTANVSLEDREACLKSGMNDFLTKPLNGEALDKTLERWSRV